MASQPSVYRREPGDWPCSQCGEFNFKSRNACRRCSTSRGSTSTPRPTPQIQPREGDWTCRFCLNINFAARIACNKCGRTKQDTANSNAGGQVAIVQKSGDWTCQFCKVTNFSSRAECYQCRRGKPEPMNVDSPPHPPPAAKPGDWKCPSCPETNFGSRTVCRSCGAARPSSEAKDNGTSECVICMEKSIDSVITTCGHSAVCLQCGAQVTQCPICRNPFTQQQLIKLYNVY
ncbi:unnamed protein product [Adineta ricciae]|uniref:Uncharacterized protein n=1 Tax=Adineta ricciae TaxID=249248 RepID=A0A815ZDQ4_ADIRI|nr:unnamed protein product [Adineta ricciae]CAF1583705.1 unnamed protein product [Adineta ricciae]